MQVQSHLFLGVDLATNLIQCWRTLLYFPTQVWEDRFSRNTSVHPFINHPTAVITQAGDLTQSWICLVDKTGTASRFPCQSSRAKRGQYWVEFLECRILKLGYVPGLGQPTVRPGKKTQVLVLWTPRQWTLLCMPKMLDVVPNQVQPDGERSLRCRESVAIISGQN